jgi:hypothetical protein
MKQLFVSAYLVSVLVGLSTEVTFASPPVVIVEPAYPMPAPGYVWLKHPRYGWGWHHPQYGWHKRWDYVERPGYPMPGPGYVWMSHPRYGWGWYHPQYGWHKGWDRD